MGWGMGSQPVFDPCRLAYKRGIMNTKILTRLIKKLRNCCRALLRHGPGRSAKPPKVTTCAARMSKLNRCVKIATIVTIAEQAHQRFWRDAAVSIAKKAYQVIQLSKSC